VARLLSRRSFIGSGACLGAAWLSKAASARAASQRASANVTRLTAISRTVEINGRAASVMGLESSAGGAGLSFMVGQPFDVLLENQLSVPTAIHWHGLHPPNNQDGVPGLTQPVVEPGKSMRYHFPVRPSGTHWMHSHEGLQEAFLLSSPLVVHDRADEHTDEQQIVVFLGDFSFTPPAEILARLRTPKPMVMGSSMAKPDANDVDYDAYLTNDRTLADPQVVRVERGSRVRLRIINGSSGTNFFVDLGALTAEVIATDGMPVKPVRLSRVPLAIAQRVDLRFQLPQAGAFPILAHREYAVEQTGLILATADAVVRKLPLVRNNKAGLLNLDFERNLVATSPLSPKAPDSRFELHLTGDMRRYSWGINGVPFDVSAPSSQVPRIRVKRGERVAVHFINDTPMSHPMHLHGHSFQVIAINGQTVNGALRDTLLVPGKSNVTIAFDANNPGTWYLHCHVLWHLAAGMATLVSYH
jgi:FtsP/CotA-like multicopper oxidase with cupredoxin domain